MQSATGPIDSRLLSWVFAASVFLGAALLFQLEPLVGKSLLPWYGGTPAVWNTCVFYFQLVLLLGYLYAHLLHRFLPIRRQVVVHAVVVMTALLTLPIRIQTTGLTGPASHPVASVLRDLSLSIGLIFFVISTTAPLLQAWYISARPQGSPYVLYVASNTGSLVGLLTYPTIIEFWLPLSSQSMLLTAAFVGLVVLFGVCGALALRGGQSITGSGEGVVDEADPGVTWHQRIGWLAWSLCPSSLMLGVTTFLSAEIAPMPAIWMLPLSLYLLSFIIAFARTPRWVMPASTVGFIVTAILIAASRYQSGRPAVAGLILHNALLFFGAVSLHCRLAAARPGTRHLTEFYLWISIGGLCGSLFNTLLAPLLFNWLAEYPLAISLGLCLVPAPRLTSKWSRRLAWGLRIATACLILIGSSWDIYFSADARNVIHRERSFYGNFHIVSMKQGTAHQLMHGTTLHGVQVALKESRLRRPPLTYYFNTGPIGQLIRSCRESGITRSVAIVGLGIGSLSAYAEQGDEYTFYEIDPAIDRIARDTKYFTYLRDTPSRGATVRVVLGDARLRMREAPDASFGLIVLDAFTSDSIPVHLLTKEAIVEYVRKLRPDGLLACHISNSYLNLEGVLANIANDLKFPCVVQYDDTMTREETLLGKAHSIWLVISPTESALQPIQGSGRWRKSRTRSEIGVWTDDYSNLLSVIHWK